MTQELVKLIESLTVSDRNGPTWKSGTVLKFTLPIEKFNHVIDIEELIEEQV